MTPPRAGLASGGPDRVCSYFTKFKFSTVSSAAEQLHQWYRAVLESSKFTCSVYPPVGNLFESC
eukprot:SAG31_NODE_1371_length_8605_cov_20.357630_7_plen_64_part_00